MRQIKVLDYFISFYYRNVGTKKRKKIIIIEKNFKAPDNFISTAEYSKYVKEKNLKMQT